MAQTAAPRLRELCSIASLPGPGRQGFLQAPVQCERRSAGLGTSCIAGEVSYAASLPDGQENSAVCQVVLRYCIARVHRACGGSTEVAERIGAEPRAALAG